MRLILATLLSLALVAPAVAADQKDSITSLITDKNHVLVVVPIDKIQDLQAQLQGAGESTLIVIPADQFAQWSSDKTQTSASAPSAQTSSSTTTQHSATTQAQGSAPASPGAMAPMASFEDFHRSHVLIAVPADKLADLQRQLDASTEKGMFVLMPADRFGQVANLQSGQSSVSSTTVQSTREQTSFQPSSQTSVAERTSLPAVVGDGRTYMLNPAGESNAVNLWFPSAGGTIISLKDGSTLLVPSSVNIHGSLQSGSRLRGEFERRGGQNLVTYLEVLPGVNESGGSGGEASGN